MLHTLFVSGRKEHRPKVIQYNMEEQVYQTPKVEVIEMVTEDIMQAIGSGGDLGGGDA